MAINTISPATFTTSILIGDPAFSPNGSHDSIPLMTTNNGSPVSAALEIQSNDSALLLSRMTTAQQNAIANPVDGMLICNTTTTTINMRIGGAWQVVASGVGGDVFGPPASTANDIAIFADNTGKLLADSGVDIVSVPILTHLLSEEKRAKLVTVNGNQIGNLSYIQFVNDLGLIFVDSLMPVEFITNNYGAGEQTCSLFTGDLPSSSTSVSALVELQSTTGALLISRMTTTQKNALTAPTAGMMVYDTTIGNFSFYNGSWFTPESVLPVTATSNQVLLSVASSNPAWSTATYPATTTINQLLYSSAANTVGGLATANSATLVTNSSGVPAWTSSMTNGQLLIGSTSATPATATLTAGTGISITNGAGSITVASSGTPQAIVDQNTSTVTMNPNTVYIIDNGASLVTLTLNATVSLGSTFKIVGFSSGGWTIAQNSGQTIHFNSTSTTTGTGGSLSSTQQYNSVTLTCSHANSDFTVTESQGNLTVV